MNINFTDNSENILQELRQAAARALERIGETAEGFAKERCPVETGRLRDSIAHQSADERVYIGTDAEYASSVELGRKGARAQPFIQPALTEHTRDYRDITEDELKNG